MKYLTEVIFWIVVLLWPFFRQSVQGDSLQTITDVSILLAAMFTLFGYWRRYKSKKR